MTFPGHNGILSRMRELSPEVRSIVQILRGHLEELYGLRLARLIVFGSRARGDADVCSDLDALVVLRGTVEPVKEIRRTGGVVSELSLSAGFPVACLFVGETEFLAGRGPLLTNVRREGIAA